MRPTILERQTPTTVPSIARASAMVRDRPAMAALAITFAAFSLYLATLAPTVLWGDDAEFERVAFTGVTEIGPHAHPLWAVLGRVFVLVPFSDVAWRANLISATFAAIAVAFVFAAGRKLARSTFGAVVGAAALAVSHTFWLHAVRAEVYALYAAFLAAILYLLLLWRAHTGAGERPALHFLFAAALLAGLAMLAHPLILTALPGIAFFVWRSVRKLDAQVFAVALVGLALGLIPYLIAQGRVGAESVGASGLEVIRNVASLRLRDVVLWVGFLGYQFLLALPLGLLGLARLWRRDRDVALFLALVFLADVGFALAFRVADQYVFYLPSYLVFALWVAVGAVTMTRPAARAAAVALVVLMPPLVYRLTPIMLNRADVQLLPVRELPYRDNNTFFLYPPKNGYRGAREFGETVLRDLPPNAAVLADWLPLETLRYLQVVEGLRPDVKMMEIYAGRGEQAPWLIEQSRIRPVFIAGVGPYYDMSEIEQYFQVSPFGPVYQLTPR